MEGELRGAQEEAADLGEEVARLHAEAGEKERQVREKDQEMGELLKAVDTLRSKVHTHSSIVWAGTHRQMYIHSLTAEADPPTLTALTSSLLTTHTTSSNR